MDMCRGRDVAIQSEQPTKVGGGRRAVLFVYVMVGLENMAFTSMSVSLVTYFYGYMNFSLTKSVTTLTNMVGTAFVLALLGGFISDTYISRFNTCVIFGSIEFLGYGILAVQAHFPQLRPVPCKGVAPDQMYTCESAEPKQEAILFLGLYLLALGAGGAKAVLPALGADQFDDKDPKEAVMMSSFFNWLFFSSQCGSIVGVTLVVLLTTNVGWDRGFAVCSAAMFLAVGSLYMGNSFFRNNVPKGSPLPRILQVFVAAFRNRDLPVPDMIVELHHGDVGLDDQLLQRTHQFSFLDRAAIARTNISDDQGPWRLCTVTQVEEAKILVRMLPIIVSTVFMNTCMAQLQTFTTQQSTTMDTHVVGNFKMPGPSIPIIPMLFMFVLIPVYDRVFVPIARKITGIPTGIRHLQRIGIGLVLSTTSMAVAGVVEARRKAVAFEEDMVDTVEPLPMSVFWLGFQYAIFGAGELFTFVGLLEFFYGESSAGMKSLGTAITLSSLAGGFFLSSVIVEVVNRASGGWLATNNLNRDKLDYFYWLLAGMSVVNFGFYFMCASWYRYKKVEVKQQLQEGRIETGREY